MSLSTNVSNLATRIATEVKAIRTLVNGNAADLSSLTTTQKSNLVLAINEVKSALDTAASDITSLEGSVGTLSSLTTTAQTDLVSAINELQSEINTIDLSALINDGQTATNTTWSSYKINSEITESPTITNPTFTINATVDGDVGAGASYAMSFDSTSGPTFIINVVDPNGDYIAAGLASKSQVVFRNMSAGPGSPLWYDTLDNYGVTATGYDGHDYQIAVYDPTGNAANALSTLNGSYAIHYSGSVSKTVAPAEVGYLDGVTSPIQTQLNAKASTSYVDSAIATLVDGAPALLNTLNELAAAINDDESFASTITTALSAKADDSAVVHLTGAETIAGVKTFSDAPVVPDASFTIAKTSGLQAALDSKASAANVGDTTVNYVTTFEAGLV